MRRTILAFLTALTAITTWAAFAANGQQAPTYQEIMAGETPVAWVSSFRVGYRLFGQAGGVTYFPLGQCGDNEYGATYEPRWADVFMHPAWKQGQGLTVVEFFVRLPDIGPAKMRLACGIAREAVGKSDGVTFRVYVGEYASREVIWEQHVAVERSDEAEIDLERWRGKEIILGIEAHPGPQESTSYDWANLYNPRFVMGTGPATPPPLPEAVRNRLRAIYAAGLKPYLNDTATARPSPGPLADGRVSIEAVGERVWRVNFSSPLWEVAYLVDLTDGDLSRFAVADPSGRTWHLFGSGGLELELGGQTYPVGSSAVSRECLEARQEGGRLMARYRYAVGGEAIEWTLTVTPTGPYLQLDFASDSQGVSALRWSAPAGYARGQPIFVPYMYYSSVTRVNDGFACAVPDLWNSNASLGGPWAMRYLPRTDGRRNPLRERLWAGYVPLVEMALQNIPNPPSPFLAEMASRPVIDIWGGSFASLTAMLRRFARYGIDHCFIIIHDWQRAGYDVEYPDVIPARESLGGDDALRELCDAANALGHRISVHENYVDFYPDAPSWNEADVALDPMGQWVKAWFHPGTKIQSFLMKPSRVLKYAAQFSPRIHRTYGTTGAYLDVHTAVAFWHKVDFDAAVPEAGKFTATLAAYAKLFQYMRDTHQGPLTGEGNNHALWAGLFDGAEAQVAGGETVPPLVAYDLLKVHPQNINHGMGYWERWMSDAPAAGLPRMRFPATVDKYIAQTITFAHAGFLGGEDLASNRAAARHYHLTRWVQEKYGTAAPVAVAYEVAGEEISLSEALLRMAAPDRVHVTYDNGLEVWVNWGEAPWEVSGYRLPQWGYVAQGAGLLQYCAERNGVICDYVEGPNIVFADARGGPGPAPLAETLVLVVPRIADFRQTGPRSFQITYEWQCLAPTRRNPTIFVHFTSPEVGAGENIAFQNDHRPDPPVSQWQAGQTYRTGPFTVTVPENFAKPGLIAVELGMFDQAGRAVLAVEQTARTKVHIADIRFEGEGDELKMTLVPRSPRQFDLETLGKLMTARVNAEDKPVDFGPVITSGCVVLRRDGDRLSLVQVPADMPLRVGVRRARLRQPLRALRLPEGGRPEGDVVWYDLPAQ